MAISNLIQTLRPEAAVAVLLTALLVYSIVKYTYRIWFHPLAQYPGPLLARASSFWSSSAARKLRKAQAIQEAHEKYGPVVRIAPDELSFSNPTVIKDIYGHGMGLPKTDFYKSGKFTSVDSVFSMRDRHQHAGRRAVMAKSFSQANIWTYGDLLTEKIVQTMDQFASRSEHGTKPVNIYHWLHWLALDIVFHFTLNHESGTLKTGKPHPIIHDLEAFQAAFAWSALFQPIRGFGRFLPIKSIREPFELLHSWVEFAVRNVQRERGNDKRTGVMTRLIETSDSYLGRTLNDIEVAEELMAIMFGGSGTTANTLCFLIWSVLRDQQIHTKLIAELRDAIPNPREVPPLTVANKLPYTNAVIMEALRRYPTIPGSQPRYVVDKELTLDGYRIPKGTTVGVQNYSIHRYPSVFPDPDAFIPERWLAPDTSAQRAAFNGFGQGPRACIGRNLAMMELQLVVPAFFRRFNAEISDTMTDEDMIMTDGLSGGPAGQKLELRLPERTD